MTFLNQTMIKLEFNNPVNVYVDGKPISQNGVYRRASNRRMFMTEAGTAFKDSIGWAAEAAMLKKEMFKKDVQVAIFLFMPDRRTDPANIEKLLLDALQGIVYENDRQVRIHYCEAKIDKEYPRIDIKISEI